MRLDPKAIAARIGLGSERLVPDIVDCPLCGSSGKLELRSVHHIQCRGCGFVGDLVRLHAAVKKESVAATVAELTSRGLLDLVGSEQTYLSNASVQEVLQKLIRRKAAVLQDGVPSSFNGMLCTLNCRLFNQVPAQLRSHMIPLSKDDVYDLEVPLPKDADAVFKWWGRLGAIGVPAYDGVDVAGFWVLTQRGSMYLPVIDRKTSAAFGCVPSMSDPAVFVVDTIEEAVRLTVWSSVHREKPIGFVVPVGVRDTPEHYAAKQVIYWSVTDDSAWILRSRHSPQNMVLLNSSVVRTGVYPFDGDFPRFMHEADASALSTYAGIAKHLLSLPHREAVKVASTEPMEPAERSKIAANASGEDARRLQALFSAQAPVTIDWYGVVVSETPDGWVCKNRVISSAMFYLNEVRPFGTAGEATVIGSVVYGNRAVAFTEKLSVIRRNTASWLENFAVQKFGVIVYIEKQWRSRLLEVSQRFRTPTAIMPEQRYGWNGNSLRMPFFIVDYKDISPSYEIVEGPRIPIPATFTEAEKDAFNSESFCRLFLIILKNILQTSDGVGTGWAMVNQPHVVERTAHALSLSMQRAPSDVVIQSQRNDPIIRPTVLDTALGHILEQGPSVNMLVSVDRLTASLANIFYGWPLLPIKDVIEYRCLRGVFLVLQTMLSQSKTAAHYRGLADVVSDRFGVKGALGSAGVSLDREIHVTGTHSTAAKLCAFLVDMSRNKTLRVDQTVEGVRVRHADFNTLVAGSALHIPEIRDITHSLASAHFLVGSTDTDWLFHSESWDFYRCMQTTLQTTPR